MKLENLTNEHMIEILELWGEHVGQVIDPFFASRVLEDIKSPKESWLMDEGYRFGCKYSQHSKLRFKIDDKGNIIPYFFDIDILVNYVTPSQ